MGLNLDGYVRVSRMGDRAVDDPGFIAVRDQRDAIERAARALGHTVRWPVEPDLDVSGGKMERPGLDRIRERIRTGKTDGILVAEPTRFARTLEGAIRTIAEIDAAGGKLLAADGSIDSTTRNGRLQMQILFSFAEWFREGIKEGYQRAIERAVAEGIHVAADPFGYTRPRGADGKPERVPLAVHPTEGSLVRQAYAMRLENPARPWSEVAAVLGMTKAGAVQLIANRAYRGEARGRDQVKVDAHPALVSETDWVRAQPTGPNGRNGGHANIGLLRGLVTCGSCGNRLALVARASDPKYPASYACRNAKCSARAAITVRLLDAWVADQVDAAIADAGAPGGAEVHAILGGRNDMAGAEDALVEAMRERDEYPEQARAARLPVATIIATQVTLEARVAEARVALADVPSVAAWWESEKVRNTVAKVADLDREDVRALYAALVRVVVAPGGRRGKLPAGPDEGAGGPVRAAGVLTEGQRAQVASRSTITWR